MFAFESSHDVSTLANSGVLSFHCKKFHQPILDTVNPIDELSQMCCFKYDPNMNPSGCGSDLQHVDFR